MQGAPAASVMKSLAIPTCSAAIVKVESFPASTALTEHGRKVAVLSCVPVSDAYRDDD